MANSIPDKMEDWVWFYFEQGFSIIPVKGRGKKPNIDAWKQFEETPADKEQIQKWLDQGKFQNIGIICGKVSNNLVVIDIDEDDLLDKIELTVGELQKRGWVVKTGKGYHLYLRNENDPGGIQKPTDLKIEWRANDGYVVAPPSIHPSGKKYKFIGVEKPSDLKDLEIRNAAALWKSLKAKVSKLKGIKTKHVKKDVKKGVALGARNDEAFKLACQHRDVGWSIENTTRTLLDWNKTNKPLLAETELLQCIKSAYKTGTPDQCDIYNQKFETAITLEGKLEKTHPRKKDAGKKPPKMSGGFLGYCENYYNKRTNAPIQYATHMTIHVIGHAMGYDCTHFIQPKEIHHNTYVALIGESTLARKTTVQDLAMDICSQDGRLPSSFSPEGLLKELAISPQGILPMGEFSTVLRHIKGNGYMANLKEIMNELHSCPPLYIKRLSKMKDSVELYNPYLCVSTTCTPQEFLSNLTDEILYGGFLARIMLVPGHAEYRPRARISEALREETNKLRRIIWKIRELFNTPSKETNKKKPVHFEFTDSGLAEFNRIDKDLVEDPKWGNSKPMVGRYLDYVIVYADILFLCDLIWAYGIDNFYNLDSLDSLDNFYNLDRFEKNDTIDNDPKSSKSSKPAKLSKLSKLAHNKEECYLFRVPAKYVSHAFSIIKPCLEYVSEVVKYVDEDLKVARVQAVLERRCPITRSTAMQNSKLLKRDFDDAIATLKERETIFELVILHTDTRERTLRVYCTAKNINSKLCKKCQFKCIEDNRNPKIGG